MSRDPKKTDEGDQQASGAHTDVETGGRRNKAEKGEALVSHHQPQDGGYDRRKHSEYLNGDVLRRRHDDSVLKEAAEAAYADSYKQSLQTQKSKLHKDGRQRIQPNRQRLDTNSEKDMGCLNTRGSSKVKSRQRYEDSISGQNNKTQKKGLKTTQAALETANNIVANPTKETSVTGSFKRNCVKPANV